MGSLNRIVLIGTLDSQPDVKATTTGDSVANFVLSVSRPVRQDGFQSPPDMIKIVSWRQQAEKASSLSQGSIVVVEGQIHNRSYDDQNGVRHYVTEVEARDIRLLTVTDASLSDINVSVPPQVEPMASSASSFDFSESPVASGNSKSSLEMPPEFGEPVEEDIPF